MIHALIIRARSAKLLRHFYCGTMSSVSVFQGKHDRYSGITVDTKEVNLRDNEFELVLTDSLTQWKESRMRGIWFKVQVGHASYVPLLAKHGFDFHHAKPGYVMMTKWLPDEEPSSLPLYPHTSLGVAGLVLNDKNEILVIKEKYHKKKEWKFPGGYANPGEDFATTAHREVLEETGIQTEFKCVVAFRHHHKHSFGCGDIYVVCMMKPTSEQDEVRKCRYEIDECKWMKLQEFKCHAEANGLSRLCVEALEHCLEHGVALSVSEYFSHITHEFQKVYHVKPLSQNQSC